MGLDQAVGQMRIFMVFRRVCSQRVDFIHSGCIYPYHPVNKLVSADTAAKDPGPAEDDLTRGNLDPFYRV